MNITFSMSSMVAFAGTTMLYAAYPIIVFELLYRDIVTVVSISDVFDTIAEYNTHATVGATPETMPLSALVKVVKYLDPEDWLSDLYEIFAYNEEAALAWN